MLEFYSSLQNLQNLLWLDRGGIIVVPGVLLVLMRLAAAATAAARRSLSTVSMSTKVGSLASKVTAGLLVVMVVILDRLVDVEILVIMAMVVSAVVISAVVVALMVVVQVQRKDHVVAAGSMVSVLRVHQLVDNLVSVDLLHGVGSDEGHQGQDEEESALHCKTVCCVRTQVVTTNCAALDRPFIHANREFECSSRQVSNRCKHLGYNKVLVKYDSVIVVGEHK